MIRVKVMVRFMLKYLSIMTVFGKKWLGFFPWVTVIVIPDLQDGVDHLC